jgi:hypothetical protein
MRWLLAVLMIGLASTAAHAEDATTGGALTDAITGVDPRDRLETGEGSAFGSLLGRREAPRDGSAGPASADESQLPTYGSPYDDLRSSLYTSPLEDAADDEEDKDEEEGVEQPYGSYGSSSYPVE